MYDSFALALKEDCSLRYSEGSIFACKIHRDFQDELICCKGVSPMRDVGCCAGISQSPLMLDWPLVVVAGAPSHVRSLRVADAPTIA